MKLLRVGAAGAERPAMLDQEGRLRDLSGHVHDIANGTLSPSGLAALRALDPSTLPEITNGRRLGPCVGGVGKVVCVGLNYTDHAEEMGLARPDEPVIFAKAVTSLAGAEDDLVLPPGAEALDYEVELAIVIGTKARFVSPAAAPAHIAGYATFIDYSERTDQIRRGGQWIKGKSHDGFGPLGPWFVTADEVEDPGDLALTLSVNGQPRQQGHTGRMIFGVARFRCVLSRAGRVIRDRCLLGDIDVRVRLRPDDQRHHGAASDLD
ncbi:MAG: fumarylacetoacetate hydrolase family protein, partial [Pseudomonadota bacterium]